MILDAEDVEIDNDYLLGLDSESEDKLEGDSQKLKLALKKRQIIEEERGRLYKVVQNIKMTRGGTGDNAGGAQLKLLEDDPFVKFYLEVYRELCGKRSIDDITTEVFDRWKTMRRKPRTTLRKSHTDPHEAYGLAWEMALGEKDGNDTNQLKFALMKNRIVSEEMSRLANFIRNMQKEKKYSVPFLKMYLQVFREMCGKSDTQEIRGEATRRYITAKRSKTERKRGPGLHECPTHGRAGRKQPPDRGMVPKKKCLYHGPDT